MVFITFPYSEFSRAYNVYYDNDNYAILIRIEYCSRDYTRTVHKAYVVYLCGKENSFHPFRGGPRGHK